MKTPLCALGFGLALLCAPAVARADAGPKVRDSLWFPMGLNFGYRVNPDPLANGFLLGPEVSLVYITRSLTWAGVYGDVLRDFGTDVTRMSVGAEAGVAILGLDVGYMRDLGDPSTEGFRARLLVSFAAVHLYGGVGQMFTEPDNSTYGEAGILLKFPIPLWEAEPDRREHRR
jgi:hypothetical protein